MTRTNATLGISVNATSSRHEAGTGGVTAAASPSNSGMCRHGTATGADALSRAQLPAGGLLDAGGAFWDASEALVNSVIGLCVSWAATFFVLGYSPTESAAITGMFFALSFSRSWIVRRVFRGLS